LLLQHSLVNIQSAALGGWHFGEDDRRLIMKAENELQRTVSGVCLILAPLFIMVGEILRFRGEGIFIWSGISTLVGIALSMQVILGLRHLLRLRAPIIAIYICGLALMLTLPGAMIVASRLVRWAMLPDMATVTAIERAIFEKLFIVIFLPGLFYPICRLVVSLGLWRAKVVPIWISLLMALGYLLFPVGRIGLIQPIIHLSDVLVLLTEGWLGWKVLTQKSFWERG
jgi:hypothetical protein